MLIPLFIDGPPNLYTQSSFHRGEGPSFVENPDVIVKHTIKWVVLKGPWTCSLRRKSSRSTVGRHTLCRILTLKENIRKSRKMKHYFKNLNCSLFQRVLFHWLYYFFKTRVGTLLHSLIRVVEIVVLTGHSNDYVSYTQTRLWGRPNWF